MKLFEWNEEKGVWLRKCRGVAFDEILYYIQSGNLLDVLEHSRPDRYPGQRIFVVNVEEYVFLVPFVETAESIFLKTIIPSRKMTRHYLKKGEK